MGHQSVPMRCWRTASMATSEASGMGYAKRDAVARASLT